MTEETLSPQVEPQLPLEAPETPAVSLRDTIEQARDTIKEKQELKEIKADKPDKAERRTKAPRERDDTTGKFKGKEEAVVQPVPQSATPPVAPVELLSVPAAYTGSIKTEWAKLPLAVQQELIRREQDVEKGFTKFDEERNFGKQLKELATPYLPIIRAEGGDINKAFSSFLDTAYKLRTKNPQEKGQILMQLAREYGADLSQANTQQAQVPFNPVLHQVQQELQGLKGTIEQEKALKKQQEDEATQRQIDAFRSDPKNTHFDTVKAHMAALLTGGLAKDLQDAYDQAVHANPQTRSTLLEQSSAQAEEKRLAEQKAKAEAAKKAGSSVRGSPGVAALKNGKIEHASLRDTLKAAYAEAGSA